MRKLGRSLKATETENGLALVEVLLSTTLPGYWSSERREGDLVDAVREAACEPKLEVIVTEEQTILNSCSLLNQVQAKIWFPARVSMGTLNSNVCNVGSIPPWR
jgi:hypothetical protein